MTAQAIDTADHVHHAPTDEDWVVAYVEGEYLTCCGWPETRAKVSDCTLIRKVSKAERDALLRSMAGSTGPRASYARHRIAMEAPVQQ